MCKVNYQPLGQNISLQPPNKAGFLLSGMKYLKHYSKNENNIYAFLE